MLEGDRDGQVTTIPTGLRPRLLDMVTTGAGTISGFFHRAKHFSFGVGESEKFLEKMAEQITGLDYEEMQPEPDAPHPFDNYTFTFWLGLDDGVFAECLIVVATNKPDDPAQASMVILPWNSNQPTATGGLIMLSRETAFAAGIPNLTPEKEFMQLTAKRAWAFVDCFRRLLSSKEHLSFAPPAPPRKRLHKGRQVTHYSPSEITLNLAAIQREYASPALSTGRHVVGHTYRAHLCHSRLDPNCNHEWQPHEPVNPEHGRWTCSCCGGRRWHRRGGQRGDFTKTTSPKKVYRIKTAAR